jgi:3-hydroxyacyl-[acyl-carrier-protein] dehydratase
MKPPSPHALILGTDVIQRLIPHRRPFLMVDGVTEYERGATPRLRATRSISANEDVFAGHFPGLHLWPGVYTIEGLSQATLILQVITHLEEAHAARGGDRDDILRALRNLELGYTLRPGFAPERSALLTDLARAEPPPLGMTGAVEIKLEEPVFAGQTLTYEVTRTHTIDRLARFDARATVSTKTIARGTLTGVLTSFPLPA